MACQQIVFCFFKWISHKITMCHYQLKFVSTCPYVWPLAGSSACVCVFPLIYTWPICSTAVTDFVIDTRKRDRTFAELFIYWFFFLSYICRGLVWDKYLNVKYAGHTWYSEVSCSQVKSLCVWLHHVQYSTVCEGKGFCEVQNRELVVNNFPVKNCCWITPCGDQKHNYEIW